MGEPKHVYLTEPDASGFSLPPRFIGWSELPRKRYTHTQNEEFDALIEQAKYALQGSAFSERDKALFDLVRYFGENNA